MSRRRTLALAAGCALATSLVIGPGASATPAPTPQQLAEAQRRVADARAGLADVQVQAEQAVEAYNGAQVRVEAAQAASGASAATAADASVQADRAQAAAQDAQRAADVARGQADAARVAHQAAIAAQVAAQQSLDAYAAGAYRAGGNLALLSALLHADPTTFVTGQAYLDRADAHQKQTVDALTSARAQAEQTAAAAAQAERTATAQAEQAGFTADQAARAAATARAAASDAAAAATAAVSAAESAAAAKTQAQHAVDQAQLALGSASANAADLAAKAEQARREAALVQRQAPRAGAPGSPATAAAPASGSAAQIAIAAAFTQIGVPYSWGGGTAKGPSYGFAQGANTNGFDCSGLTLYAYAHAGVRLDHFTGSQWNAGRHVSRDQLVAGDLVFFATDTSDPGSIHHVGLYIGGGRMIEAPHTGDVVKVSNALRGDLIGGVRLVG